jgi:hypothetical protein
MDLNTFMTAYGFPILGLVLAGAIYWFIKMWRNPRHKENKVIEAGIEEQIKPKVDETMPVFYSDDIKRRVYENYQMPVSIIKDIEKEYGNLGKSLNVEGNNLYCITKSTTGIYHPTIFPVTMEYPTTEVPEAILNPDVEIFFNVEVPKSFMANWGPTLLFCGFVIFVLWTVVMK